MLDPNEIQSINFNRGERILKGFVGNALDQDIEKAKLMPIGTISNGRKKIGPNKWIKVSEGKSKHATDHIIENKDGSHHIDSLHPDTGEKKFKEGDKIHYKNDAGKDHKGVVGKEKDDGVHEVHVDEKKEVSPKSKEGENFPSNTSISKIQQKIYDGANVFHNGKEIYSIHRSYGIAKVWLKVDGGAPKGGVKADQSFPPDKFKQELKNFTFKD